MRNKIALLNEIKKYLYLSNQGSDHARKERFRLLRALVDDLVLLKIAPKSFAYLSPSSISMLVNYWRDHGSTDFRIMIKLGALRTFIKKMNLGFEIMSNKELGLKKDLVKTLQPVSERVLDNVYHPIINNVLAFQIYFGLTKSEAIRIDFTAAVSDSSLIISRAAAGNSKQRIIPIVNNKQQEAIACRINLLNGKSKLSDLMPELSIKQLYSIELNFLNLDTAAQYRRLYAKERFDALKSCHSLDEANNLLKTELGFVSDNRYNEFMA